MNGDGGRGGFNKGRCYQGRNFNPAYDGRGAGRGRFPSGGGGGGSGPGGGRFNGNNNRSGFFQGESSGTVGNRENDFGGGDFQENRGGANVRVSSGVDDAFLQKTVAAVVAAVTAAQKPPDFVAQHGSVVRGDVSNANPGSEPSGAVPQGGDLHTEHVVQPAEPQTQAQERALEADVPKPKEVEGAGPAKKKKLDKNGWTYKPKVENPRLAKVTVEGETMTIPDIIENLKRVVPYDNFNWEVPSEMTFDFWSALEEPLYMLPEVWMRVSGIPSDIRTDFLTLWGVGSMFGKAVEVDMAFTRKNKILRIKIGCINPSLIPQDSDFFIKRGFFKLHFEVEMGTGEQDADMIEANGGQKDDDGSDGANKDREEDNDGKGNAMEMDGANGHTDKEDSNTMEINENEGHNGKQAALDRSSLEFKLGTFVSQVKLSGTNISASVDTHNNTDEIPILHVQKQILDAESEMFSDADLDTILVLPKYFGGDAARGSEMSDVAQEERLLPLSIEMGQTGNDTAETESSAAMCPLMPMATPNPSSPMTAAETVKCMGVEEEPLHILPDSTSSLYVTRDKINGAGHVLRAEEIK
ncbi:hypothetical protein ACQ4PT_055090 [Festuca glaucescens]